MIAFDGAVSNPQSGTPSTRWNGSRPRQRIAQLAPLLETIPPARYGGTEQVIATLTEELVERGHDVTLFASGESRTSARLVTVVPEPLWRSEYPLTGLTALDCGSVPEVIRDGHTGIIRDTEDQLVEAVEHIPTVDWACCRADTERRFSADAMADGYEAVDAHVLAGSTSGRAVP